MCHKLLLVERQQLLPISFLLVEVGVEPPSQTVKVLAVEVLVDIELAQSMLLQVGTITLQSVLALPR
tara:strand:- start:887 stop:1087 length:201 start_codon:yes stop_codon:yes gene_type:complete